MANAPVYSVRGKCTRVFRSWQMHPRYFVPKETKFPKKFRPPFQRWPPEALNSNASAFARFSLPFGWAKGSPRRERLVVPQCACIGQGTL